MSRHAGGTGDAGPAPMCNHFTVSFLLEALADFTPPRILNDFTVLPLRVTLMVAVQVAAVLLTR